MAATELDLAMAFYTALRKLDLAAMFDVLDPDVRLRHPEAVPWGGDEHGYVGVRRFLERLVLHVNGQFDVTEILDGADTAIAGRFHGRIRATNVSFSARFVHTWTASSGRLTSLDAHLDIPALQRALDGRGWPGAVPATLARPTIAADLGAPRRPTATAGP